MDLIGIQMILGDFPADTAGDLVNILVDLWNGEIFFPIFWNILVDLWNGYIFSLFF